MRFSPSNLKLKFLTALIPLFTIAFFMSSVAKYYLPYLYYPGAVSLMKFVFWSVMTVFVLISTYQGIRVPKTALYTVSIFAFLSIFGSTVGMIRAAGFLDMASHLSHNLGAMMTILATSTINIRNDDIDGWLSKLCATILIISGCLVFFSLAQTKSSSHVSLTLMSLSVPFVLSIVKKRPLTLILSIALLVLTIKRGLWLAAIATLALHRPKNSIWILCGVALISIVSLVTLPQASLIYDLLIYKFVGNESASLDALTSGRIGIFVSLHAALESSDAFYTGLGFGSEFDAYYSIEGKTTAWITNGVDVSLGHFWFLYGYILGSVCFLLYSLISLVPILWALRSSDDILVILSSISFFLYVASLSTFVAWDPLQWVVIGLVISRRNQLKGREGDGAARS